MSSGEGPPPVFNGDDFPYWKVRMESYMEAIDPLLCTAAVTGFPAMVDMDIGAKLQEVECQGS